MSKTLSDEGLREKILRFYAFITERDFEDVKREYLGIAPAGSPKYTVVSSRLYMATETFVASVTSDRKSRNQQTLDPFDFVEPCEPDCSPVRHAYHKGQWDMATKMKASQEGDKTSE